MVKKLIGVAAGLGMVLATVAPSFAATVACGNQTTGYQSANRCLQISAKIAAFRLNNTGGNNQSSSHNVNSGGNVSNYNTAGPGAVSAGAANAETIHTAVLNSNAVGVTQTSEPASYEMVNHTTGAQSTNLAVAVDVKAVVFGITNNGTVNQSSTHTVNSGNNSASYNTVGGSVTTGAATSSSDMMSGVNTNEVTISQ